MTSSRNARAVRGPFTELTIARVRELIREPEAVFWVFVFPILLAGMLGVAFRSRPPDTLPVAIVAGSHAQARLAALSASPDLRPAIYAEAEARQALARGRVVLAVSDTDRVIQRMVEIASAMTTGKDIGPVISR